MNERLCQEAKKIEKHKPALVSLEMEIASSSVLNRKSGATGPNTSSLKPKDKLPFFSNYKPKLQRIKLIN